MEKLPEITLIVYLAFFGLGCAVLLVLGALGWLIWFVINHVQIV